MNRHLATLILGTLLLAQPVLAQDHSEPQDPPTRSRRADLTSDCVPRDGLSLCLSPRRAARKARQAVKEQAGRIGRFARLAGLFMGRSDAAEFAGLKFRVNLEIH